MSHKAIVLGGGITGLTTAWKLGEAGYNALVVEKDEQLGGQARTIRYKDYYLDLGAHKIFTVMEDAQRILEDLACGGLLKRKKIGRIRFGDIYLPFPVGIKDVIGRIPYTKLVWLAASLLKARFSNVFAKRDAKTYEDWFVTNYGRALYETFVKEPTEKIWGVTSTLSVDLARRRVTHTTLWEHMKQILFRANVKRVTKADYFYYPKYGCQVFVDSLAQRVRDRGGRIATGTALGEIRAQESCISCITLATGEAIALDPEDVVISTIPKRAFIDALRQEVPGSVDYALTMLRERNLLLVYIMLDQPKIMEDNWIFFPERRFLFTRLSEMKNCSPYMAPEDKTFLCCEMTCHVDQRFTQTALKYIVDHMVESLHEIKVIDKSRVIDTHTIYLDHAYPLWDTHYSEHLACVLECLDGYKNLYSIGRQGAFVYGGIADCLDIGLVTAKFISAKRPHEDWPAERSKFNDYIVVD